MEGIFSGTLSYIFNSFVEGTSFSEIVAEAKAAGYTEPDPRDDLAGMDVARKVTILARCVAGSQDPEHAALIPLPPKRAVRTQVFKAVAHLDRRRSRCFTRLPPMCFIARSSRGIS